MISKNTGWHAFRRGASFGGCLFLAACSSLPSIGPRTANGLPTHVDGGAGQVLRFCEKMHDAGDLTTAAATCERAHRLDPGAPEPLLELASILGEMNEPDLSIAAYRAILKTSPANADAHYGLGRTYLSQGQNDLALVEFKAALNSNRKDPRLYTAVGVASGLLGAHVEAQKVFRKGLLVAPQDVALRNNLGLSLVQSGRYDQGLLILEALAKDTNVGQASRDNLLMAQGLAATARAEIMLAEAQAEAEAEALARAAALEAAKPKIPESAHKQPKESRPTTDIASAPMVLDFSFPQASWPMDGPGQFNLARVESPTTQPVVSKARQNLIARALAKRPKQAPRPLTAPIALTKSMIPAPDSPAAIPAPQAQLAKPATKARTQAARGPSSHTNLTGRQTARADFGATSDAGKPMKTTPMAATSSAKSMPAMPQPSVPPAMIPAKDAYTVQFASYTSEERAWRGWDALLGSASGLLNDIEPQVGRADLGGDMGTVYRLRTQPAPRQAAKSLCAALKAKGLDCLVIKSEPEIAENGASSGPATL